MCSSCEEGFPERDERVLKWAHASKQLAAAPNRGRWVGSGRAPKCPNRPNRPNASIYIVYGLDCFEGLRIFFLPCGPRSTVDLRSGSTSVSSLGSCRWELQTHHAHHIQQYTTHATHATTLRTRVCGSNTSKYCTTRSMDAAKQVRAK